MLTKRVQEQGQQQSRSVPIKRDCTAAHCCICVTPPPSCISYALVQATVGVGTVIIVYIGVAYATGGGYQDVHVWSAL